MSQPPYGPPPRRGWGHQPGQYGQPPQAQPGGYQGQPGQYGPPGQPGQRDPYPPPGQQPYPPPPKAAKTPKAPKPRKAPREPYQEREPEPPGPHPAEDLPLASLWRRLGARLIDGGLLGVFGFAIVFPIMLAILGTGKSASDVRTEGGGVSGLAIFSIFFVVAVLPFLYEGVQLGIWGRTLGKRLLSLRVVTADPPGEGLPWSRALIRAATNNIVYWIGCAPVGTVLAYLWAFWDQPLQQAVHDKLARTVVIDERYVEYEEAEEAYVEGENYQE